MAKGSIVKRCLGVFPAIKATFEKRRPSGDLLRCRQGFYKDCAVIKLQNASWTNDRINDPNEELRSQSGIFFSVWIDEDAAMKSRANYNIHALKMRHLKGYSITSRNFAEDFRNAFKPMHDRWPNVRVDYGPLTLMQGWIEVDLNDLAKDILPLLERFTEVIPLIDHLLKLRLR